MSALKEQAALIYIDGKGQVLGRLASIVAKKLLEGNRVVIVNIEKVVLKGSWSTVEKEWQSRFELKSVINPFRYSPKRPVRPDMYFRRVVRGMLPWRKAKGRQALRRLRVYIGVPKNLENLRFIQFEEAQGGLGKEFVSLARIASRFGWRGVSNTYG